MDRPRYIVVEGPPGVGKGPLAAHLARRLHARQILDPSDTNPFLQGFYQDRRKFAFQAQLFFLLQRYAEQEALKQQELFSRSIVADYLFSRDMLYANLILDRDELLLYRKVFSLLDLQVLRPDLVVYLEMGVEPLTQRLRRSNPRLERQLRGPLLEDLVEAYNRFFFTYQDSPLLVVRCAAVDLERSEVAREELLREILAMGKGTKHYVPLGE